MERGVYSEGVLPSHGVAIGAGGPGGTASFPWSTLIGVFSLIDVLYYAFAFRHVILQVFITLLPVTLYYESFLAPFLANGSNDCCCYSSTGNSAWTTFSASSHSNNANLQLPSLGSTPPSSAAAASPVILEATSPTSITQSPIWLLKEGRRRLLLCFWLIFIPTRSYELLYDAMSLHKKEDPQDGRPFMPLKSLMVILLYSFILPELGSKMLSAIKAMYSLPQWISRCLCVIFKPAQKYYESFYAPASGGYTLPPTTTTTTPGQSTAAGL